MNKYCPAGKCECEHFDNGNNENRLFCLAVDLPLDVYLIEVCPYPSRQVPVEKPELNVSILEVNGSSLIATNKWTGERWSSINGKDWEKIDPVQTDYNRGRTDMKREIGAAVKLLVIPYTPDEFQISTKTAYNEALADTLAAIEEVK